tara:strand:- start:80 stop:784 length:705 start_codon:yes stop_codon:yes gene_type:complete
MGIGAVVAVVGNGPLSDEDRRSISRFEIVYRFNDLKNHEQREKCTHHVIRCSSTCPDGLCGSQRRVAVAGSQTILVGTREEVDAAKEWMRVDEELVIGDETSVNAHPVFSSLASLPEDPAEVASRGGAAVPSSVLEKIRRFPTSGTIVLDMLNSDDGVDEIHVFGMNWNMFDAVHSSSESQMIHAGCRKCVVHSTPSTRYLPAPRLEARDAVDAASLLLWVIACVLLFDTFCRV